METMRDTDVRLTLHEGSLKEEEEEKGRFRLPVDSALDCVDSFVFGVGGASDSIWEGLRLNVGGALYSTVLTDKST